MPKDRKEVDQEHLDEIVKGLARQLEDQSPHRSQFGFSNTVYIGKRYVYKLVPLLADGELEHPKERGVLEFLSTCLPESARQYVPRLVHSEQGINGLGCVDVYTKLPGTAVDRLAPSITDELGGFLRDLHGCARHGFIHEFEGEVSGPNFSEYVIRSVDKFIGKLHGSVADPALLQLAERARTRAQEITAAIDEPELLSLHKDLFGENILAEHGHLTGIIDWEAAQSGPREWEFAILRQRFPEEWWAVYESYGQQIDQRLLNLCGLVQSLRFWKSFPHQDNFVKQQVDYIREILGES